MSNLWWALLSPSLLLTTAAFAECDYSTEAAVVERAQLARRAMLRGEINSMGLDLPERRMSAAGLDRVFRDELPSTNWSAIEIYGLLRGYDRAIQVMDDRTRLSLIPAELQLHLGGRSRGEYRLIERAVQQLLAKTEDSLSVGRPQSSLDELLTTVLGRSDTIRQYYMMPSLVPYIHCLCSAAMQKRDVEEVVRDQVRRVANWSGLTVAGGEPSSQKVIVRSDGTKYPSMDVVEFGRVRFEVSTLLAIPAVPKHPQSVLSRIMAANSSLSVQRWRPTTRVLARDLVAEMAQSLQGVGYVVSLPVSRWRLIGKDPNSPGRFVLEATTLPTTFQRVVPHEDCGEYATFRVSTGEKRPSYPSAMSDALRDTVFYTENIFRFMSVTQSVADELLEAKVGAYRVVFVAPIETLRLREEVTLGADAAAAFGVWTDRLPSTRLHVVLAQECIKRVWVSGP